jgi:quercetin dioxygenase-like cupin family protein
MKSRILFSLLILGATGAAQGNPSASAMQHKHLAPANIKAQAVDFLPACARIAPLRGDPSKEAATIFAQADSRCVIPWHWHTAVEELMIVSGRARIEMKDGGTEMVRSGSYLYLPGKNVHQFTCEQRCSFYLVTGGAFDIHYVDQQGNEIPMDQAVKQKGKKSASLPK